MSFGRPPSFKESVSGAPPDRGSFPLDHFHDCTTFMTSYLACLKLHKNDQIKCRRESKDYLGCRMEKGLMEKVGWEDLGLADVPGNGGMKEDNRGLGVQRSERPGVGWTWGDPWEGRYRLKDERMVEYRAG